MTSQPSLRADVVSRRMALQTRILPDLILDQQTPKQILADLQRHLIRASEDGWLTSSMADIKKYLRLDDASKNSREFTIYGARLERANFNRSPDLPHFTRADGVEFDFLIAGRNTSRTSVELLAYDCELRFPDTRPVRFVRFDLNPPGHANELPGLRCHVHPGHDDLQAAAPLMHPLDIIDLCLYGLTWPDKIRAT